MKITIETVVNAQLDKVWKAWNTPEDIKQWNTAQEDWHTTHSTVDLREGGKFLLDIGNYVALYPRPTRPTYQPAVGETLSQFLTGKADGVMDSVNHLEVTLDGKPIEDVLSYRYVSDGLFELTGDPSLAAVYDARILGWGMPGISDGFFMMFKPLSAGMHTLRVYGTNTFGDDKTYIYYLNVQ